MFKYCIFARDSVATRQSIMFSEKLPEKRLEIVKAADVTAGVAANKPDSEVDALASDVTH